MNKLITAFLVLSLLLLPFCTLPSFATEGWTYDGNGLGTYTDPESGHTAYIMDGQDLYTPDEENEILSSMKNVLKYCDCGCFTGHSSSEPIETARDFLNAYIPSGSGTVFLIDLSIRQLTVFTKGEHERTIDRGTALSITDNVYTYATDGDYARCAVEAFGQIFTLLEGGKISRPMKHLTNAMFSVSLALLIAFGIAMLSVRNDKGRAEDLVEGAVRNCRVGDVSLSLIKQTKVRHQSSSGGAVGGFGGGGGGGGGGSGGSHGF